MPVMQVSLLLQVSSHLVPLLFQASVALLILQAYFALYFLVFIETFLANLFLSLVSVTVSVSLLGFLGSLFCYNYSAYVLP